MPSRDANQRPMTSSDTPAWYTSAVSTKLPPASTNASSCACAPASSVSLPNVIVPRQRRETLTPVPPISRYSMSPPRWYSSCLPHQGRQTQTLQAFAQRRASSSAVSRLGAVIRYDASRSSATSVQSMSILRSRPSHPYGPRYACLLYTSDAADDLLCVDLGGRRI